MSEGTESAKRILHLPVRDSMTPDHLLLRTHRIDASHLHAPVHVENGRIEDEDEEDRPWTAGQMVGLILLGAASWGLVGLLFWGSMKLAEVLR